MLRLRACALILAAALSCIAGCREKPEPKSAPILFSSGAAVGLVALSDLPEPEEEGLPLGDPMERTHRRPPPAALSGAPPLAARLVVLEKPASRGKGWEKQDKLPRGELEQRTRQAQGRTAEAGGNRMRAELGHGYLSPSSPRGPSIGQEAVSDGAGPGSGRALRAEAAAGTLSVSVEAPVIEDFDAKARDEMLQTPESGSYRVQVSFTQNFEVILFEKVYIFEEEMLVLPDLRAHGLASGVYWVRIAFIDLLDFQQPFSSPKKFRLRNVK